MVGFRHIQPLGDSAVVIDFGDQIDEAVNSRVHTLAFLLAERRLAGVIAWVPTYASLTLHYDPLTLSYEQVAQWVNETAQHTTEIPSRPFRLIEIPTRYGGKHGPDLDDVAQAHGLTCEEVVTIHSQREYLVFMLGFTPGFSYLGKVDERIATPRLTTPRQRVPAGSVGIAAQQTGIYPIESPGGWRIIGRTALTLFDPDREPPFLIAAGDHVKFVRSE